MFGPVLLLTTLLAEPSQCEVSIEKLTLSRSTVGCRSSVQAVALYTAIDGRRRTG